LAGSRTATQAAALTPGSRCALHPDQAAVEICSRCGNFVCPQCLVLSASGRPHCTTCESRGEVDNWRVPWERRAEIGFFRGYWDTTKAVMFSPQASFQGMSPTGRGWWDPLSYLLVSCLAGISGLLAFWALYFAILFPTLMSSMKADLKLGVPEVAVIVIAIISIVVLYPLLTVAFAFVWGGVEHLALRVLGVQTRGYEATVRAYCYASAPQIWGVIPLCGSYLHPIWQLVCRILGYRGVHRTTGGRATAAVLLPVGLCCGGITAVYIVSVFAIIAAAPK
jgi:hypothetical protein